MPDYRVNLEIYNGPIDLLLYLIRRDEVDIYDIPIARITEQYVRYVEVLQQLDPNLAGDFLVMAATLIEIKTRMLLPTPPPEEGGEGGLEIDPRAELVRQLLEYKAFKDAAGDLRDAADAQARRFPRRPVLPDSGQEEELDLEDVQVWDLLDAFSKLMSSIGANAPTHQVIYDDTPIELHQADILDRLQREGAMTFRRIFEGRTERIQLLGLFLAVLELVRLKLVLAIQNANFGEIHVCLNPNPPEEMAGALQEAGGAPAAVAAGALALGQDGRYIADRADADEDGDRHGRQPSQEDGNMKPTDDDLDDKDLGDDDLGEELDDDLDEKDDEEDEEDEEEEEEEDDDIEEGDEDWDDKSLDEDEDEKEDQDEKDDEENDEDEEDDDEDEENLDEDEDEDDEEDDDEQDDEDLDEDDDDEDQDEDADEDEGDGDDQEEVEPDEDNPKPPRGRGRQPKAGR